MKAPRAYGRYSFDPYAASLLVVIFVLIVVGVLW